eukprot:241216_1
MKRNVKNCAVTFTLTDSHFVDDKKSAYIHDLLSSCDKLSLFDEDEKVRFYASLSIHGILIKHPKRVKLIVVMILCIYLLCSFNLFKLKRDLTQLKSKINITHPKVKENQNSFIQKNQICSLHSRFLFFTYD